MKKLPILTLVLSLLLGITSCSNEENSIQMNPAENTSNHNGSWSKTNNIPNPTLFEYTSVNEAKALLSDYDDELAKEYKDRIATIPDCTNVRYKVKLSNGKALLTELLFIDSTRNLMLEGYILNEFTGEYNILSNESIEDDLGSCPTGWTSLTTCPHFLSSEDFANCMGSAQQQYTNATLTEIGSCMELMISIGNVAAQVCGRTC